MGVDWPLHRIYFRRRLSVRDYLGDKTIIPSDNVLHCRGLMTKLGERSGWVVTTPTGITGSSSCNSTRNAPISLASASLASTSAKSAPMQILGPAPNGR